MAAMTAYQFLRIVEIRTKIVSVSSFAVGTLYAAHEIGGIDPVLFALMFAAVLCVDMGTTAFNTFYDYMRGVDSPVYNKEGDKVLVHQGVAPGIALLVSIGLFLSAMILGMVIGARTSFWVVVVGATAMTVGFLYNAGPMPISRTPIGEPFAGVFLGGVVVVLSFYVHAQTITPEVVIVSLPSTLFIAAILTTNNTCDIEGDREAKRRTLSVVLGRPAARWVIYAEGLAAYAIMIVSTMRETLPQSTWVAVALGVPFSVVSFARMHRRGYSHDTKGASMAEILRAFTGFSLLLCAALAEGAISIPA